MATILSIGTGITGNTSSGSSWDGGVPPGPSDIAFIRGGDNLTVDVNSSFAFHVYDQASLTLGSGVTLTQSAESIIGGYNRNEANLGKGTFVFGPGSKLDNNGFPTYIQCCSVDSTATFANPAEWTGSGDVKNKSGTLDDLASLSQRFLGTSNVKVTVSGNLDFRYGAFNLGGGTITSGINASNMVFSGLNGFTLRAANPNYDYPVTLDNLYIEDCGSVTLSFAKEGQPKSVSNVYAKATSRSTLTVGTGAFNITNLICDKYVVQQESSNSVTGIDQYVSEVITPSGGANLSLNGAATEVQNFYFRNPPASLNPHPAAGSQNGNFHDGVFDVEFSSGDDGDPITYSNTPNLTVTRVLSIKSSGLVAHVGPTGGTINIDHCTARQNTAGFNSVLKFENVTSGFAGTANIKNTLHFVDPALSEDYMVVRSGINTELVSGIAINNSATSATSETVEPGENMTGTATVIQYGTNPDFVDVTRDLDSYGGIDYLLGMSGYNNVDKWFTATPTDASVNGLLTHVYEGFTPTNDSLKAAADDGGDIGAVPVQSAPAVIPANIRIPEKQWVNVYEQSGITVGTQIEIQNVGGGLLRVHSGATVGEGYNLLPVRKRLQNVPGDSGAWVYGATGGQITVRQV